MTPKRKLLRRLSACRKLGAQAVLDAEETEIFLSLLKPWQRYLHIAAWGGWQCLLLMTGGRR